MVKKCFKILYFFNAMMYNKIILSEVAVSADAVMKLYEVLSKLNGENEFEKFFQDLCTFQEVDKMEQRIQCAQMLLKGETYTQIIDQTDISSATLSRVSRCIQHGSGGYEELLKKMLCENGDLLEDK